MDNVVIEKIGIGRKDFKVSEPSKSKFFCTYGTVALRSPIPTFSDRRARVLPLMPTPTRAECLRLFEEVL